MKLLKILSLFIALSLSSCSAKKERSFLGDSLLIITIEERDFNRDTVTQYSFYDNALMQTSILHDTNSAENLFKTEFKELNKKELEKIQVLTAQLQKLDYENSFPWKEGLYDRGNVYKVSFVAEKDLEYLKRQDKQDPKAIKFEKILYYYEGHEESPEVFKELAKFIEQTN